MKQDEQQTLPREAQSRACQSYRVDELLAVLVARGLDQPGDQVVSANRTRRADEHSNKVANCTTTQATRRTHNDYEKEV